jgi:acetyltransferase-like isoleucine patch superfamily enzyme
MNPAELAAQLKALYEAQDEGLRREWDRSLPFADGLLDRWERARRLGFGEDASIYNSALVYGDVSVGRGTWIGPYTLLDGSGGGLSIGAYCSISAGVQIYTHDTVMWALSGGQTAKKTAPVSIGECCYLGSQAVIAAGTTIGNQCVVAANSFVNRAVPERTIVGGSPARPLGHVVVRGDDIELVYPSDPDPRP